MTQLADAAAREAARLDLDRNVIVEAGAGTGKTTLLIDRIVFLLLGRRKEGAPVDVSRLVALTFTEKAAAEIKFRLVERLDRISAALQGSRPADAAAARCIEDLRSRFGRRDEEILALAQAALRDVERAQIGTLHSFCAHILRLYPLQAEVDPEFVVDAGEAELGRLFEDEWALWLDRELGCDAPRPRLWRELLRQASLESLGVLARELVGPRVDLDAAEDSPGVAERLLELERRSESLSEGRPRPKGRILEYLAWMGAHFRACAGGGPSRPPPLAAPCAWPANWDSRGRKEYERLAKLAGRLDSGAQALYRRAAGCLRPFVESFRELCRRRGIVTFDGLLIGARDLVRGDLRARAELKARFDAFLIDEFQDTDPVQIELLMFLAESPSGRASDWRRVEPQAGKLFIVGDPKQSIYRFRGADIAALESFGGHLARHGALRCSLQANFRSSLAIVDCVNGVFTGAMRALPGLQPAYVPIQPAAVGKEDRAPQWLKSAAADAVGRRRAEADWIARWIARERAGYRLKDIALILRSTSSLGAYLEALKSADVPYVVEGEKYFYGTQEVTDFLNLLRAIDDPEDRVALVGLLRSPLAALHDRDVYRLAREGLLDYRLEPPRSQAGGLYRVLRGLRSRAGRTPLGELVEAALRETLIVELDSKAYHRQQTASNLLKLGRMAAEASRRGETLKEFISRVESSVRELREEGESPLADDDFDAVRVLTIHKAKGLEYPVVILPNLGAAVSGRGTREALRVGWSWPAVGLRLEGCPANAAMVLLEAEEEERQRQEEVRVLYVAMTRAKERLFLLGAAGPRGADSPARLLERASSLECRPLEMPGWARSERGPALEPAWIAEPEEIAAAWRAREERESAALGGLYLHPSGMGAGDEAPGRATGGGALLGSLCHEVLERWDFGNHRALSTGAGLGELIDQRSSRLARESPSADWPKIREEARRLLVRFLASPRARTLASAEILGREVPFAFARDGAVIRGVIDLLYRDERGLVVADYKTDAPEPGSAAFQRYQAQGALYVSAVEQARGERGVRFELISLRGPG